MVALFQIRLGTCSILCSVCRDIRVGNLAHGTISYELRATRDYHPNRPRIDSHRTIRRNCKCSFHACYLADPCAWEWHLCGSRDPDDLHYDRRRITGCPLDHGNIPTPT